jgi:hypothetical protein
MLDHPCFYTSLFMALSSSDEHQVVSFELKLDQLLENTKSTKSSHQYAASRMSSEARNRHFKCLKVDLNRVMLRLSSYDLPAKTETFFKEVVRYSGVMCTHLLNGRKDEKIIVQPEIRTNFWENTRLCLNCNNLVELVDERAYSITVEDEADKTEINGKTDHTIKIKSCDFGALTLEDKAVGLTMNDHEIGQAVTEVVKEVSAMDKTLQYVPLEYCGILQNGIIWIFIFRKVNLGSILWQYVEAPPTSVNGEVVEDNCRVVARLLEHAYCVVEQIVHEITGDPTLPAISLLNLKAGDRDDDDDKRQDGYTDKGKKGGGRRGGRDRGRGGGGNGGGGVHPQSSPKGGGDMGQKNSRSIDTCNENLFLPLTAHNVMKQPTASCFRFKNVF